MFSVKIDQKPFGQRKIRSIRVLRKVWATFCFEHLVTLCVGVRKGLWGDLSSMCGRLHSDNTLGLIYRMTAKSGGKNMLSYLVKKLKRYGLKSSFSINSY